MLIQKTQDVKDFSKPQERVSKSFSLPNADEIEFLLFAQDCGFSLEWRCNLDAESNNSPVYAFLSTGNSITGTVKTQNGSLDVRLEAPTTSETKLLKRYEQLQVFQPMTENNRGEELDSILKAKLKAKLCNINGSLDVRLEAPTTSETKLIFVKEPNLPPQRDEAMVVEAERLDVLGYRPMKFQPLDLDPFARTTKGRSKKFYYHTNKTQTDESIGGENFKTQTDESIGGENFKTIVFSSVVAICIMTVVWTYLPDTTEPANSGQTPQNKPLNNSDGFARQVDTPELPVDTPELAPSMELLDPKHIISLSLEDLKIRATNTQEFRIKQAEKSLLEYVKPIPRKNWRANWEAYRRLVVLNPHKKLYQNKRDRYRPELDPKRLISLSLEELKIWVTKASEIQIKQAEKMLLEYVKPIPRKDWHANWEAYRNED